MSDTPRTDRVLKNCNGWHHVPIELARELERELTAANTEIEEKRKDVVWLATEKAKLENYVMLLEEAGDALLELCEADESQFHLADQIDARCDAWRKAKEDKL